jgi:hypothetical protein
MKVSYIVIVWHKKQITNSFTFGNYHQNIKVLLKKSGIFGQNSPNLLLTIG